MNQKRKYNKHVSTNHTVKNSHASYGIMHVYSYIPKVDVKVYACMLGYFFKIWNPFKAYFSLMSSPND